MEKYKFCFSGFIYSHWNFFNIRYDSSIVKRFIERFADDAKTNNQLTVSYYDKKSAESLPIF